jgi:hypothetical protein
MRPKSFRKPDRWSNRGQRIAEQKSKGCLVLINRAVAGQGLMIDGWSGKGIVLQ